MAITKPTNTDLIRPLEGAITRRCTVGSGGVTAGDIVAGAATGVVVCDGDSAGSKVPLGIAVKTGSAGDTIPVVVFGAVGGFTGATVGVEIYPDDTTAGLPVETASTNKYSVGNTLAATTVFVRVVYVA